MPIKAITATAGFLLKRQLLKEKTGARFAPKREWKRFLSARHDGLLMNGSDLHLTEKDSFQNVCVIARIGAGKTTNYILPNVYDRGQRKCSLVINDPSGEVYAQTSAYMQRQGFNVIVINPEDVKHSSRFNPLFEVQSGIELEQLAHILIRSGNPNERDPFWNQGAIRLTTFFLKVLLNASAEKQEYFSLANLFHLFQNFGEDGEGLDNFMLRYAVNPNNPHDRTLIDEWRGHCTGNSKTIQSFISTALTSLQALANPELAWLTATSTIELADLRRRKTVIYFITPSQHADYYGFLTSIFFQSVFNMAMRQLPSKNDLPIYVLYDEFGHSTLPNFIATANTIRKYKVSLSIVLQSVAQLNARYGRDVAQSIRGGFSTYLTFAGSDPDTTQFFERIIGQVRERQRQDYTDHMDKYQEYNLLNASEIRTIPENTALMVSGPRNPVLMKVTPHYQNPAFAKALRAGAAPRPKQAVHDPVVPRVRV